MINYEGVTRKGTEWNQTKSDDEPVSSEGVTLNILSRVVETWLSYFRALSFLIKMHNISTQKYAPIIPAFVGDIYSRQVNCDFEI